jgi:lysophospholipase L1-like esterase
MNEESKPVGKNWLERHPKKVLFLLVFLVVASLAALTEKILAIKAQGLRHPGAVKRYIKLREFEPLYADILTPNQEALRISDSLVQKGYVLRIDADGFIMPSRVHQHPDLTVAFLGGSTTECVYVDEADRFPYLAGRLLEKKTGLRVNSYNAAKSGNDSLHSLNVLLNKIIPLKPRIVVMMHNINDLSVLLYEGTYWNRHHSRSPLLEKKLSFKTVWKNLEETGQMIRDLTFPNLASQIKRLVRFNFRAPADEFKEVRGKKITIRQDHLVSQFSLNLQTFINLCQARGITPVLMTQPSRLTANPDPLIARLMKKMEKDQGITYNQFKEAFDLFNETIREMGARNRILVIDLAKEIPPSRENLCDVAHFNDRGSRLVAASIAEALSPLVTAPAKPSGSSN